VSCPFTMVGLGTLESGLQQRRGLDAGRTVYLSIAKAFELPTHPNDSRMVSGCGKAPCKGTCEHLAALQAHADRRAVGLKTGGDDDDDDDDDPIGRLHNLLAVVLRSRTCKRVPQVRGPVEAQVFSEQIADPPMLLLTGLKADDADSKLALDGRFAKWSPTLKVPQYRGRKGLGPEFTGVAVLCWSKDLGRHFQLAKELKELCNSTECPDIATACWVKRTDIVSWRQDSSLKKVLEWVEKEVQWVSKEEKERELRDAQARQEEEFKRVVARKQEKVEELRLQNEQQGVELDSVKKAREEERLHHQEMQRQVEELRQEKLSSELAHAKRLDDLEKEFAAELLTKEELRRREVEFLKTEAQTLKRGLDAAQVRREAEVDAKVKEAEDAKEQLAAMEQAMERLHSERKETLKNVAMTAQEVARDELQQQIDRDQQAIAEKRQQLEQLGIERQQLMCTLKEEKLKSKARLEESDMRLKEQEAKLKAQEALWMAEKEKIVDEKDMLEDTLNPVIMAHDICKGKVDALHVLAKVTQNALERAVNFMKMSSKAIKIGAIKQGKIKPSKGRYDEVTEGRTQIRHVEITTEQAMDMNKALNATLDCSGEMFPGELALKLDAAISRANAIKEDKHGKAELHNMLEKLLSEPCMDERAVDAARQAAGIASVEGGQDAIKGRILNKFD